MGERTLVDFNRVFYSGVSPWFHMELDITGKLDQKRFVESIKNIIEMRPILTTRFEKEKDHLYAITDEKIEPIILFGEKDCEKIQKKLIKERRTWGVAVYEKEDNQKKEERFVLLLFVNHMLGDGSTGLLLLSDIVNVYCNNKRVEKKFDDLAENKKVFEEMSKLVPAPIKEKLDGVSAMISQLLPDYSDEQIARWQMEYLDIVGTRVDYDKLDFLEDGLSYCKKNNVTLGSLAGTLLAKIAAHKSINEISMSVSLRKILNVGDVYGNYGSQVKVGYRYDDLKTFEENLHEFDRIFKEKKNPEALEQTFRIMSACNLAATDASLKARTKHELEENEKKLFGILQSTLGSGENYGVNFINMGTIELPETDSDYTINELIYVPNHVATYNMSVLMYTFKNTVYVVSLSKNKILGDELIDEYIKESEMNLKEVFADSKAYKGVVNWTLRKDK